MIYSGGGGGGGRKKKDDKVNWLLPKDINIYNTGSGLSIRNCLKNTLSGTIVQVSPSNVECFNFIVPFEQHLKSSDKKSSIERFASRRISNKNSAVTVNKSKMYFRADATKCDATMRKKRWKTIWYFSEEIKKQTRKEATKTTTTVWQTHSGYMKWYTIYTVCIIPIEVHKI